MDIEFGLLISWPISLAVFETMATAPPPPASGAVPPPSPPPPAALPRSGARLESLKSRHMSLLRRLDKVESAMAAGTASHRRRFVGSAASSSGYRKTHARVFVSHRVEGNEEDGSDGSKGKDEKKAPAGSASGDGKDAPPASAPAPAPPSAPVPNSRHGGKDLSAMKQAAGIPPNAAAASGPDAKPTMGASTQPRKGKRRWTLVIEGGLLVPQVDHDSARKVDARLAASQPVLGCPDSSLKDYPDEKRPEIPLRDQWRGGTGEVESTVNPVKFTHLFDRLEVEMKAYKRPKERDGDNNAITRSAPPPPAVEPEERPVAVQNYTWVRTKAKSDGDKADDGEDSHAFFVPYLEDSEFRPMGGKVFKSEFNVERVTARAKLYRRSPPEASGECNYAPSKELCDVFFPSLSGGRAAGEPKGGAAGKSNTSAGGGGGGGSKSRKGGSKRKRSSAGGEAQSPQPPASAREESVQPAANPPVGGAGGGKGAAFERMQREAGIEPKFSGTPLPLPLDRDVFVPPVVTLDEVLHALALYVRGRNLGDPADPATVHCDADLERLLGSERVKFSDVRKLLLERRLIVPVSRPIVLNYEMTLGGAEPLTKRRKMEDGKDGAAPAEGKEVTGTRRKSATGGDPSDNPDASGAAAGADGAPVQSMLSFDLDVTVPDLYPTRVRELLRRANHREFAFAGPRLRAEKSLVATGLSQADARKALAVAATGRTHGAYQRDAVRALARGASAGGEAEVTSLVDLRTVALCERLDGLVEGRAACLSVLGTVLAGRSGG